MAQTPDFKIKGRLVFRPDEGDTEHDLGEVEFTLAPQLSKPVMRSPLATSGAINPPQPVRTERRGPHAVIPQDEVRRLAGVVAPNLSPSRSDGMTVDMYNGK